MVWLQSTGGIACVSPLSVTLFLLKSTAKPQSTLQQFTLRGGSGTAVWDKMRFREGRGVLVQLVM